MPTGLESWIMLGEDGVLVDSVERYLAYLTDSEAHPTPSTLTRMT